MRRGLLHLSFCLCLSAAPASAQRPFPATAAPRASSPDQRQKVIDLAYILGQAHALHRVCAGGEDNTWRGRMSRLIKAENPDEAYRQQLMNSFNAGFTTEHAAFTACSLKSDAMERAVAAKGRDIARRLAADVSP